MQFKIIGVVNEDGGFYVGKVFQNEVVGAFLP
jgi:hypothetical protein